MTQLQRQAHPEATHVVVVLDGCGTALLDGLAVQVVRNDTIVYPPGDAYFVANTSTHNALDLLWISDPALPASSLQQGALVQWLEDGAGKVIRNAPLLARGIAALLADSSVMSEYDVEEYSGNATKMNRKEAGDAGYYHLCWHSNILNEGNNSRKCGSFDIGAAGSIKSRMQMHSHYTVLVEGCAHHLEVHQEDSHRLVMKFDVNFIKLVSSTLTHTLTQICAAPPSSASGPPASDATEREDELRTLRVAQAAGLRDAQKLWLRRSELQQHLSELHHDSLQRSSQHWRRCPGWRRGEVLVLRKSAQAPTSREHHHDSGEFDGDGCGSGTGGTAANSRMRRSGGISSSSRQ
ncbi:hypothetical protein JKP88DRAFT_262771 [Tribonema minus]|uniref:Uncharacterized protein n=1 Tax=Tribonema minus TaxID=303371 RepID=A0A835Z9U3_9STRA|nr:hypothetical protein JKP88DRAFT_262771 [Tribonema minus]